GSVLRHFVGEVVGRRRSDLHGEAACHGHAVHLFVVGPSPGVAVERAFGIGELAPAVEFAVGVGLAVGGISHDGHAGTVAHGVALVVDMADEEEVGLHPVAFLGFGHFAGGPHGAGFDVAIERP